ncbi:MAG: SprT-like domain-containing protein [Crocinitomicaceae bacterium]|nr:SprT-like domain-containing protein [Crocinitomicaceae bacterium]
MERTEKIVVFSEKLRPFLPAGSEVYVAEFIVEKTVHFTVSKPRKTKLGDYRQPWDGKPHRISVNGNLNKYAFLITTIHEMAHLTTHEKYGNRVKSHGTEWKSEFKKLFQPLITRELLPTDVSMAVNNYLKNAKAASCSDDKLYRVLRRYDKDPSTLVEHLEQGDIFELKGKRFILGKKLRKRYECKEVNTGRTYRVLGLAEVEEVVTAEIEDSIRRY